jgi:hypothetical protein
MQKKFLMNYYYICIIMANVKNCVIKITDIYLNHFYIDSGSTKWYSHSGKQSVVYFNSKPTSDLPNNCTREY